jgi:hypothetical protein
MNQKIYPDKRLINGAVDATTEIIWPLDVTIITLQITLHFFFVTLFGLFRYVMFRCKNFLT